MWKSEPWWDAMRRLRTMEPYSGWCDSSIVAEAEEMAGKVAGTATVGDLEALWVDGAGGPVASVPYELTRSEVLVEIGRYPKHHGETPLKTEGRLGVPPTSELADYLNSLGGPASSCPERTTYEVSEAVERLRRTEILRGRSNEEIFGRIQTVEGYGVADSAYNVDEAAWCFDLWDLRGEGAPAPSEPLASLMEELREGRSISDSDLVDEIEGEGGPANLERLLGRTENRKPPKKDFRWWNAMRKLRTLEEWGGAFRDEDVESFSVSRNYHSLSGWFLPGPRVREATTTDLLRLYDLERPGGVGKCARAPFPPTRSEVLDELAKFERYEGAEAVEEEVPREGNVATTEELRSHLDLMGGPASCTKPPPGWWDALRNLRRLEEFQQLEDFEILSMAWEPTPKGLRGLYERSAYGTEPGRVAKVPRKLERDEVIREISKYECFSPEEMTKVLEGKDVSGVLDSLGGPASSCP